MSDHAKPSAPSDLAVPSAPADHSAPTAGRREPRRFSVGLFASVLPSLLGVPAADDLSVFESYGLGRKMAEQGSRANTSSSQNDKSFSSVAGKSKGGKNSSSAASSSNRRSAASTTAGNQDVGRSAAGIGNRLGAKKVKDSAARVAAGRKAAKQAKPAKSADKLQKSDRKKVISPSKASMSRKSDGAGPKRTQSKGKNRSVTHSPPSRAPFEAALSAEHGASGADTTASGTVGPVQWNYSPNGHHPWGPAAACGTNWMQYGHHPIHHSMQPVNSMMRASGPVNQGEALRPKNDCLLFVNKMLN